MTFAFAKEATYILSMYISWLEWQQILLPFESSDLFTHIYLLPGPESRRSISLPFRVFVYIRQIQIARECVYCGNSAVCSTAIAKEREHLLPSIQIHLLPRNWRIGNRFRVIYLPTIDTRGRRVVICISMRAAGIGLSRDSSDEACSWSSWVGTRDKIKLS